METTKKEEIIKSIVLKFEKFKTITIIGLTILCIILFSLKKCGDVKNCPTIGDTIIVNIDTIWPKDTVIITKWLKPKPADSIYVPFFVNVNDSNIDSLCNLAFNMLNYVKFYKDSIENDDILLYVEDSVRGIMTYKSVFYKLKIPKEIRITTKEYVYPKWDLYGGGFISKEGESFNFGPMLGLRFKNLYLSYSRGITVPSNSVTVGLRFQVNIKKVKKNLFF